MTHFQNAQRHMARLNIFSNLTRDLKKVVKVNFRMLSKENIQTNGQENFPITPYVKDK